MDRFEHTFRRRRLVALAAVASALGLTGCGGGGGSGEDEIAKQVEIATQAADRAVAAQLAAEAAAKGRTAPSSLTGSGFRKDTGNEPAFGSPTDGRQVVPDPG